jgi:hypothetical protein
MEWPRVLGCGEKRLGMGKIQGLEFKDRGYIVHPRHSSFSEIGNGEADPVKLSTWELPWIGSINAWPMVSL